MIIDGLVPERVITLVAAATIFTVMFTLGLGIVLAEFRGVARSFGLVARALFAVLVAVPVLAVVVVRGLDLPRSVQVGIAALVALPFAPPRAIRGLRCWSPRRMRPRRPSPRPFWSTSSCRR